MATMVFVNYPVKDVQASTEFYEKLGFNEVDIRKNYYPKPDGGRENAVVMACYLQNEKVRSILTALCLPEK